jgi:hypothetical protein
VDINDLRVTPNELLGPQLQRLRTIAMGMAAAGAVLCVIGLLLATNHFFESYLYAYMFWFGVTGGSLGLLMLHHTVGGGWSFVIRRFLEAGSRLILPMAVLFIPIALPVFLRIPALYAAEGGWAHADAMQNHLIQAKAPWLNPTRFILFAILYFAAFWLFSVRINRLSATQDERADPDVYQRLNYTGAGGIVAYVLLMTFVSVDWVMSLTPDWFSSIFGLLTVASQGLSTLALMLVLIWQLGADKPLVQRVPSGYFRDLGNLMLALVMLWAYLAFSQYLIIYSGNLVEEVSWYVRRNQGGWIIFPILLITCHFALPFLVLVVGSRIKKDPAKLGKVAAFMLLMRFLDLFWLVAPTFRNDLLVPSAIPADLGAPLLLGGIWLFLWTGELMKSRQPVVPLHDPRFLEDAHTLRGHGHEVVTHG